jgi:hypothetical protein
MKSLLLAWPVAARRACSRLKDSLKVRLRKVVALLKARKGLLFSFGFGLLFGLTLGAM